jgi:hypothetical protein
MFWIVALILLVNKLFLAGKDADSYLLKEKHGEDALTFKRIKRWHRDGVALDLMFTAVLAWATGLYAVVGIQSILIRLAVYDLAFNYWAKLNFHYLGSTAFFDRIFSKIFGINGAVKKSLFFLALLIGMGIYEILR